MAAIGLGALLAPVLASGTAAADPDTSAALDPAGRIPPASPSAVTSELLARGSAGEFRLEDAEAGISLDVTEPSDVAVVRATLAPHSSTGFHRHPGPSVVVVVSGTLQMIEPAHRDGGRCTQETYPPGSAFPHPSGPHTFANRGAEPAVLVITYLVPEGASPAPVPVDPQPRC
ncbi:cupin domain-containing protein [Geodermatophilus sp. SYSU D00684]